MKGWVYVITNKAMPDLVKVGFTTKDPELRAVELNNTGSPHPYKVAYEVLVEDPQELERMAHRRLVDRKEGKEWFRCSADYAASQIKKSVSGTIYNEQYKRIESAKVQVHSESIAKTEEIRRSNQNKQLEIQAWRSGILEQQNTHASHIRTQYLNTTEKEAPKTAFWIVWIGCAIAIQILFEVINDGKNNDGLWFLSAILGAIAAVFVGPLIDSNSDAEVKRKQLIIEQGEKIRGLSSLYPSQLPEVQLDFQHILPPCITGNAGFREIGGEKVFSGTLKNVSKHSIRSVKIRVTDSDIGATDESLVYLFLPPGRELPFQFKVSIWPSKNSWQILETRGVLST